MNIRHWIHFSPYISQNNNVFVWSASASQMICNIFISLTCHMMDSSYILILV
uniref:Uncharacterized protein n=1 Tax=Arundo donax TaxID=35708 RepID=A0A0A8YR11_ARUDO